MLGEYKSNVKLPKTKNELVRVINRLGNVDIEVVDLIDDKSVSDIKVNLDRFLRNAKKGKSIVFIKER